MSKVLDMRRKRGEIWDKAKAFLDARKDENGLLSAEDTAAYERMEQEVVDLGYAIEREERAVELERELSAPANAVLTSRPEKADDKPGRGSNAYNDAFWKHMRTVSGRTSYEVRNALQIALAASVSPINVDGAKNTLQYIIKSRPVNTAEWENNDPVYAPTGVAAVIHEDMIRRSGVLAVFTAYQGYEYRVEVADRFETSAQHYTIPTNTRQMVLSRDGKSVAFGGSIVPNSIAFYHPVQFLGGLPHLNWSTEEVDTGAAWIDGKRLYAKTIVLTGTSQPSIASIVDIAETVMLGRTCSITTYSSKRYASNSFYASSTDNARVFLNLTDKVARATFGTGHSNQTSYIEILYTKK